MSGCSQGIFEVRLSGTEGGRAHARRGEWLLFHILHLEPEEGRLPKPVMLSFVRLFVGRAINWVSSCHLDLLITTATSLALCPTISPKDSVPAGAGTQSARAMAEVTAPCENTLLTSTEQSWNRFTALQNLVALIKSQTQRHDPS